MHILNGTQLRLWLGLYHQASFWVDHVHACNIISQKSWSVQHLVSDLTKIHKVSCCSASLFDTYWWRSQEWKTTKKDWHMLFLKHPSSPIKNTYVLSLNNIMMLRCVRWYKFMLHYFFIKLSKFSWGVLTITISSQPFNDTFILLFN